MSNIYTKLNQVLELLLARYSNEQIAESPDLKFIYTTLEDVVKEIELNNQLVYGINNLKINEDEEE